MSRRKALPEAVGLAHIYSFPTLRRVVHLREDIVPGVGQPRRVADVGQEARRVIRVLPPRLANPIAWLIHTPILRLPGLPLNGPNGPSLGETSLYRAILGLPYGIREQPGTRESKPIRKVRTGDSARSEGCNQ